jgi:translation initiation factor 4A
MKLRDPLLRGVYAYGYEKPSPIQTVGIMPMIAGRDTIAQASSGTGKTATFALAVLQNLDESSMNTQALILAPTRELATQIQDVVRALGYFQRASIHMCVGGTRVGDDVRALKAGVQVVVGTPGRVRQLALDMQVLKLDRLKMLVLDEAHEMLSMGFKDQIHDLFRELAPDVQVCLISATLPPDVLALSERFMRDPVRILLKPKEVALVGIAQYYVGVEEKDKLSVLCDLYETMHITQAMIFCNLKRKVDWLRDQLTQRDFTVATIHSDMSPGERAQVMKDYRQGLSRVLISTDLLACGIDVQQVGSVLSDTWRCGAGACLVFIHTRKPHLARNICRFPSWSITTCPAAWRATYIALDALVSPLPPFRTSPVS